MYEAANIDPVRLNLTRQTSDSNSVSNTFSYARSPSAFRKMERIKSCLSWLQTATRLLPSKLKGFQSTPLMLSLNNPLMQNNSTIEPIEPSLPSPASKNRTVRSQAPVHKIGAFGLSVRQFPGGAQAIEFIELEWASSLRIPFSSQRPFL